MWISPNVSVMHPLLLSGPIVIISLTSCHCCLLHDGISLFQKCNHVFFFSFFFFLVRGACFDDVLWVIHGVIKYHVGKVVGVIASIVFDFFFVRGACFDDISYNIHIVINCNNE